MTDHETMTISALRYALNRRSYIMSVTDEYITKMLKGKVSSNFLSVCVQDIEDYYRDMERMGTVDPLQYDWKPLLERLKEKGYSQPKHV